MKIRYKIKGTQEEGEVVRLILTQDDLVKKPAMFNPMEFIGNPDALTKMQTKLMRNVMPDTVCIPREEWDRYKYKIGDTVWIDVLPGE